MHRHSFQPPACLGGGDDGGGGEMRMRPLPGPPPGLGSNISYGSTPVAPLPPAPPAPPPPPLGRGSTKLLWASAWLPIVTLGLVGSL